MLKNNYNYNNQTGMFRQKIALNKRTIVRDSLLQEIETYELYGNYWAMVKTSNNRNEIENGAENTRAQRRFVIKYAKSLDDFLTSDKTSFQLVHKGVNYNVLEAVDDNDLHKTITIYVEAFL